MSERAAIIRNNLAFQLTNRTARFMTLTLRHSNTPLNDQIDRIYREFRALRRREWWKRHVDGGAAFLEVKLGARSGMWHPHLHVLVEGSFLPQKELSREWHSVTGDSTIVDIRPISDAAAVGNYVVKYVTKPADSSVFRVPDKLDEMMVSLRGRRLCLTFGTWRGWQLEETAVDETEWKCIGKLSTFVDRAAAGDDEAKFILNRLRDSLRGKSGDAAPWERQIYDG